MCIFRSSVIPLVCYLQAYHGLNKANDFILQKKAPPQAGLDSPVLRGARLIRQFSRRCRMPGTINISAGTMQGARQQGHRTSLLIQLPYPSPVIVIFGRTKSPIQTTTTGNTSKTAPPR